MAITSLAYDSQMALVRTRIIGVFILAAGMVCGITSSGECSVPLLIQIQPPSVQSAWDEIETIIHENEKLKSPTAEPYLVRAEIWVKAGSHEDALRDYLTATDLLLKNQSNPADQSAYLARLRTALDELVERPRPHLPDHAQHEFWRGMVAFRSNRIADAVWSFEEACRLDSYAPLYHIYRGVGYKKLGRTEDAEREVAVAVSLIRYPGVDTARELADINSRLETVQGPLRNWLNETLAQGPTVINARLQSTQRHSK